MKKSLIFYFLAVFIGVNLALSGVSFAQAKKKIRAKKKTTANSCAENALFNIGEKGRKFLSKEQIKRLEDNKKSSEDRLKKWTEDPFNVGDRNKAKPIEPKPAPAVKKIPDGY